MKNQLISIVSLFFLMSFTNKTIFNKEIALYISVNGSDNRNGTSIENSFATLEKARNTIRKLRQKGELNKPVTVYQLSKPFVLTTEDSGTEELPITCRAYENEKLIISSGLQVRKWAEAKIVGQNKVEVWHVDIPDTEEARYAWSPNPEGVNLNNKEGFPASLFKTKDYKNESI